MKEILEELNKRGFEEISKEIIERSKNVAAGSSIQFNMHSHIGKCFINAISVINGPASVYINWYKSSTGRKLYIKNEDGRINITEFSDPIFEKVSR